MTDHRENRRGAEEALIAVLRELGVEGDSRTVISGDNSAIDSLMLLELVVVAEQMADRELGPSYGDIRTVGDLVTFVLIGDV